ncbi:c-type cytochrome [Cyclobacterium amurskyense]|uniref:Cytochrome c class I n=1 Tax=Cyclobacterium amurskyense TaxID=320787 RepID=A0A0H4PJU7_9BACT|nr:c-type cytochrome [Cyclobacterium amurskyense]AKP53233.1 Cytochrome c class I [Cyclobacterium amurskyense]
MNIKCLLGFLSVIFIIFSCNQKGGKLANAEGDWLVPDSVKTLQNRFTDDESLKNGKALFQIYCSTCHGAGGRGDGAAGQAMGSQPADLLSTRVQGQTDGELFYKITKGKAVMPSFQEFLSEEQRWSLVGFIKNLKQLTENSLTQNAPIPLVPDIEISHFTKVVPRVVRIWSGPNNYLWYANIDGEIYRLPIDNPHQLEKMLDVSDHGISRLQGATMHENVLLLSGNVRVNENKGTIGRLVRVKWDEENKAKEEVVFTTEEYGTTNTPFDHGWSALQVSPDGQYLYVVSGSRTDHGEVQDNLGAYPNSRDVALTSKIFRIPIDAVNLLLPDNLSFLKEQGYLYAEGLRNAYDLALDKEGRLMAVVNSGDYDQNEDMFWVREAYHYGYPWIMGGMESPQQFSDWIPDPEKDPFLNPSAAAWPDDFYNDPDFPKRPEGVNFGKSILNYGPDADKFRDNETGEIKDASNLGIGVRTFTPHSSPLGLVFDNDNSLPGRFKGKGLVARYTNGQKSALMQPFTKNGEDLLLLDLQFLDEEQNFKLNTYRIAEGFTQPVDAVLLNGFLYVIEFGGKEQGGNIWKVTFNSEK